MVQDVVIEPVGNGPYVSITVEGAELGHMASKASIEFEASCFPVLTMTIPFFKCKYNGKCMVQFQESENDYPIFESLVEENEMLRQRIDDLNRKISILLDT